MIFEQFELAPEAQIWVHLFWTAPLVLALSTWAMAARARKLRIFGHDPARSGLWLASLRRRRWRRAAALAACLVLLTAAAVQPRANPRRTRFRTSARDIAVILDVSKSMLADDLKPTRLERAKLEIEKLCQPERLKGDRLGLIVFAGDAVIKCPLTSNYTYIKNVLRTVDSRSAPQGGTRIGDAIRKALGDLLGVDRGERTREDGVQAGETVLDDEMKGERQSFADILLITDGEDMESYPVHAARRAAQLNVGIYAVGLGSEGGTPIPIRGEGGRIEHLRSSSGEIVKSRLDSKALLDMVNAGPRGQYLPVGTSNFDLAGFYEKSIALEAGREIEEEQVFWTEIFQPFLLAGLVLYLIHLLYPERPPRILGGQVEGRLVTQKEAA